RRRSGSRCPVLVRAAPAASQRRRPRLCPCGSARPDAPGRAAPPHRNRAALHRAPDEHPRCQRRPQRFPGKTPTDLDPQLIGSLAMLATLSPVQKIIDRCTELFEDLDFNYVKEWKAAKPGRK